MKSNQQKLFIFVIFLITGYTAMMHAQAYGNNFTTNRPAQYYLGSEDELLVPVNIWGFVQKPGQFFVPASTDLITLMSVAGGPTEDAKISNIKVIRNDPKRGNFVWKVDVKKFLETGDERIIPELRPGDTIIVQGSTFHWISRFFEFVSRLVTIAQIFYFIALYQKNID